jgi:hypothetical protein
VQRGGAIRYEHPSRLGLLRIAIAASQLATATGGSTAVSAVASIQVSGGIAGGVRSDAFGLALEAEDDDSSTR